MYYNYYMLPLYDMVAYRKYNINGNNMYDKRI